jgi:hypothetical protein
VNEGIRDEVVRVRVRVRVRDEEVRVGDAT